MSYRFVWKRIASGAVSSTAAKVLLSLNRDELWERLARIDRFTPEQIARVRGDIERTLTQVESAGRQERELLALVAKELLRQVWRGGSR